MHFDLALNIIHKYWKYNLLRSHFRD